MFSRTRRAISLDKSKDKQQPQPPTQDEQADAPPDPPPETKLPETIPEEEPDATLSSTDDQPQEEGQEKKDNENTEEEVANPGDGREEKAIDVDTILTNFSQEIDQFITSVSAADPPPPDLEIPSCVEKFTKFVELYISKYDSGDSPAKLLDEDSSLFFDAVDRISKLTSFFSLARSPESSECIGSLINIMSRVLQRAMLLLEEEFKTLLVDCRSAFDPDLAPADSSKSGKDKDSKTQFSSEQGDHCVLPKPESTEGGEAVEEDREQFPGYTPETIANLKKIATVMISSGYQRECCHIYSIARRNAFEERMNKLGFDKISIDDVQKMQWDSLEREIVTWIDVTKRCISVYFAAELKLCQDVFASDNFNLFSDLMRNIVNQLLIFAEAVGMTKRSAEKLFKLLDMYEALRDLIPKMDELFPEEEPTGQELKSETSSARCRLGEAAVGIFCDLENSIKSDMGKTPVPGGAVHPLTRYTMNYVKYACEYKDTLEQVFHEHQRVDRSESEQGAGEANTPTHNQNQNHHHHNMHNHSKPPSPFSVQLMKVMDLLDLNLDAKSKLYKDISLSNIFLMNNGRYIMQKIKGSVEIHDLMGDTWCRKRSSDLRQYHKNYQRETWSKVLACLKDEGLNVNGKVAKPVLKERFKSFNAMFEEIHKTQSTWVVIDQQLQSELRVSISAVVIPAYRSFLGRFRQYLDPGRQTEKYIKFGPEDVETYIDDLFDGNAGSMVRRRN